MIVYRIIRILARITAFFFFRKVKVTYQEDIPGDQPVIFAPNHQSAFLDPIVIAVHTQRNPWFLTRASVFKKGFVSRCLNLLHMIPVYRPRDKVDLKIANNDTFDRCQEILLNKGALMIFPEGNHGMQKRLRTPLKKGIGRIALRAVKTLPPEDDVLIIPVGINYEHPTRMRTDLLINFGRPVSMRKFVGDSKDTKPAELKELRELIAKKVSRLMIDITPKKNYDELESAWQSHRTLSPDLVMRFEKDKELIENLRSGSTIPGQKDNRISNLLHIIRLIVGFPFWIAGIVLNILWIVTVKLLIRYVVEDPHFIQSVKFLCVMVLLPACTLITSYILCHFTGWFWPFLILVPLSGLIACDYQYGVLKKDSPVLTKELAGNFLPEE
ncbi:1-acyl-sn-glycerol-3-phosphate acyltransferase [Robertkochia aurantiaca]|uniref:1-acyl-sn-glycerol-3-phosphate acyltransferase n=1 Tax=Robertkochia aurantiaca TaxID=2873700 RepID=UPI001CC921F1|nr:1-acyl-sn-glycerol-3-phosphate acyltransferase [Robertkochia sp. 3YJGBD-33]